MPDASIKQHLLSNLPSSRLLKKSLAELKSDAVVELFPGRHHGNLVDAALRKRMNEEMAAAHKRRSKE